MRLELEPLAVQSEYYLRCSYCEKFETDDPDGKYGLVPMYRTQLGTLVCQNCADTGEYVIPDFIYDAEAGLMLPYW